MQKNSIKESLVSQDRLNGIRKTLPYHYYQDFIKAWKKSNKDKAPSRQTVYKTLKGELDNIKIINTLLEMTEERVSINSKIDQVLSHAEG
ncbi:MAG TPA: hypothetical protein DCL81_13600 [Algoriphagus sp.]|jgi:hypothetical protein|uniref:hypothetical protein n=1 Tax=Algoriphagus sp. TaxID=1872435 RepID=UPI000C367566|nr:hypothetical protein [Algoriphagus sp.]MAL13311.1 hypothetical protein [Algoriphagus sp.]MAN85623.1 hypothetical protein [Algoriphagus sp.]HAH37504.1 hypothetical protein [Algoriphagus sp.]HAS57933.1 hypothetical protein [Algoriphagus sp.]HCB45359.1 hypothetical protein [Algoriphagus sp.]|tara:strand:+ start:1967 stop:2236 length:270 start_codon:yes stop_codon:yes gene_type:complete